MTGIRRWFAGLDARHRVAISLIGGVLAWFALFHRVSSATHWIATWDAFAWCLLILAWGAFLFTPQAELRSKARAQDVSSTVIFVFVVIAACAGLFAVGVLFYTNKEGHQPRALGHLLLSLLAVVASWMLVPTVFSLRYAHKFYGDHPDESRDDIAGGLE